MVKLFKEFKAFCSKGNILDLAVGVMIGGAFGSIVTSLVNDLFMPIIGLVLGGLDISGLFLALDGKAYASLDAAKAVGAATLNYGAFLQSVINFFLMAVCVFMVVKLMSKLMPHKAAPAPRLCPFCKQPVDEGATRCPHCTSELPAETSADAAAQA